MPGDGLLAGGLKATGLRCPVGNFCSARGRPAPVATLGCAHLLPIVTLDCPQLKPGRLAVCLGGEAADPAGPAPTREAATPVLVLDLPMLGEPGMVPGPVRRPPGTELRPGMGTAVPTAPLAPLPGMPCIRTAAM